jgi:superfamily II DNA helicase RecQ
MMELMVNDFKKLDKGLFVVDEIHYLSKWGQSFRSYYLAFSKFKIIFENSNIVSLLLQMIKLLY